MRQARDRSAKRRKNVLLALGWYDHRLLQGIATYAREHQWHLAAGSITHERVIPWGWQGDGVLAWLASGDDLAEFVVSVKKPTVDFSMRRKELPFARVIQDHAQTGTLVAEHFLSRGFRCFYFYSDTDNWSHAERGQGFVDALQSDGHSCKWIKWHRSKAYRRGPEEWSTRRAWLIDQLKRAAKPVAIFTANGALAVEVQELCEQAALASPDEVAIVGVEDYLLSVGSSQRSISGVDTNLEEQGYQGAALLDRLMVGENPPREPLRIAPARVVARKSSDILAVSHRGVSRGLRFITEHFSEIISVDDVARAADMSRRGLHQAFVETLGRTPGDEIRGVRFDFAKKLLAETDHKIESVAQQSGYPNINTFFVAFRRAANSTPAEFRKAARRGR